MEIRSMRESDFDGVSSLILSVYEEYPEALKFPNRPGGNELRELFGQKLAGMRLGAVIDMVVEENGRIIGECEVVKNDAENAVVGVLILKGHRRRGLGSALLDEAMRVSKSVGVKRLLAEVSENNKPAQAFFGKKGFSEQRKDGSISYVGRSL